ncbi:hypothetical protein NE237_028055 [Protea cynaroides]|uniref:VDE lipocalin domain-containing protein n=1 Tax=Protea cynaroides TaxID=273540 RepID=A0A9Q0GP61_9MAGN|nr:hypothetical protein NE237_028055 [Protea cynaroides]
MPTKTTLLKTTCSQFPRQFPFSKTSFFPLLSHQRRTARFPACSFLRRKTAFRVELTTVSAVSETKERSTVAEPTVPPTVRIIAVVGEGSLSPLKCAPWEEVMLHTADRLKWVDEGFEMLVFNDNIQQCNDSRVEFLQRELSHADILLIVAVRNEESIKWVQTNSKSVPNIVCFDSSPGLTNKLGGSFIHAETKEDILSKLAGFVQGKKSDKSSELVQTVSEAWGRHSSDDIRFCILVIINTYIRPVPILKNLRSKGLSTLNCMVQNCGPQILNCLLDPNCRKALQCLNRCSPVDQVCNYRCIASYESPNLEAFSLCVLQKNNCLELDAKIPDKPYVPPMVQFRGEALCHEAAEDLFVGWLGNLDWSWRVVAGQNPAYDQFPCQYQLFYRGKAKGSFWYEPVFQVQTLEGEMLWRRRRYRVKRVGLLELPDSLILGQCLLALMVITQIRFCSSFEVVYDFKFTDLLCQIHETSSYEITLRILQGPENKYRKLKTITALRTIGRVFLSITDSYPFFSVYQVTEVAVYQSVNNGGREHRDASIRVPTRTSEENGDTRRGDQEEIAVEKKRKTVKLEHIRMATKRHQPTNDFLIDSLPMPSKILNDQSSTTQARSGSTAVEKEKPLPQGLISRFICKLQLMTSGLLQNQELIGVFQSMMGLQIPCLTRDSQQHEQHMPVIAGLVDGGGNGDESHKNTSYSNRDGGSDKQFFQDANVM